jgi:uncharacterized oxidoreductase
MKLSNNIILITGGASGIGLGLTERFIKEGNTVIICGRRADALNIVSEQYPSVITRVCDLSDASQRIDLFEWVRAYHPNLNVLINNAGIQNWMKISDPDFYKRANDELNTNILVPIHLTTLFLGLQGLDTIINVGSGLAFAPLSSVPIYSATKAFIHSYTRSLRHQVKSQNIEVIEIIPPALNTDLGGKGVHDEHPPVIEFIESVFEQLEKGQTEITYGFSAVVSNADPHAIDALFLNMNRD